MIHEQQVAPDFTSPVVVDSSALLLESVRLEALRGCVVVLTFLPREDLIGTNPLIQDFCAHYSELEQRGIVLYVVCREARSQLHAFALRHHVPFPLLADKEGDVARLYGVWQRKRFLGHTYRGTVRTSILIDKEGIIRHVWSPVNLTGHTQQVIATIERLSLLEERP